MRREVSGGAVGGRRARVEECGGGDGAGCWDQTVGVAEQLWPTTRDGWRQTGARLGTHGGSKSEEFADVWMGIGMRIE